MATTEAVERRRAHRKLRTASIHARATARGEHDREVAVRMTRRFFPPLLYPEGPPLLALDYRFWQARRCGWDVTDKAMRFDGVGRPLLAPTDTPLWRWWVRIHYKQRLELVYLSKLRLLRAGR